MTLDQLKVLIAIVETGSFRAAAEKLHRAQSAVSYGIKTFEEEYNLRIFSRETYRPELTKEGRLLYQKALGLINQSSELENLCRYLASGMESEVRLSLSFICPLRPITSILKQFSEKFPLTNLNLSVTNMQQPIEQVINGDVDFAVSDVQGWKDQLEIMPWRKVDLIPVCAPTFAFLKSETNNVSLLHRYTQVIVSTTPRPEDGISAGILPGAKQWVVSTFAAKSEILLSGLGWGFMPSHMIEIELSNGLLIPIEGVQVISTDFFICRKKDRPFGEASQFIWDQLSKETSNGN